MLRNFVLVGLGGAAGSILRYVIALWLPRAEKDFPWATFSVNLIGCFVIGILAGVLPKSAWATGSAWPLLATGVCGGFTTFSAFALDGIKLFQSDAGFTAVLYVVLSVGLGLMCCYLGYHFASTA